MRVEEGLHLVMSGGGGFDLTDAFDCNAFLLDAGNGEWVLFDAGAGRDLTGTNAILAADGIDPPPSGISFLPTGMPIIPAERGACATNSAWRSTPDR